MHSVRIINPDGPGDNIFRGSETACRDYVRDTAVAYSHHLGVCIEAPDGTVDCNGDGTYEAPGDTWDGRAGSEVEDV
jgi:hypothetical protein